MDQVLRTLITGYGYHKVLDRLKAARKDVEGDAPRRLTARQILALPLAERDRILAESVEKALPAYQAERLLPHDQRVLTADLETGDGLDYGPDDEKDGHAHQRS